MFKESQDTIFLFFLSPRGKVNIRFHKSKPLNPINLAKQELEF